MRSEQKHLNFGSYILLLKSAFLKRISNENLINDLFCMVGNAQQQSVSITTAATSKLINHKINLPATIVAAIGGMPEDAVLCEFREIVADALDKDKLQIAATELARLIDADHDIPDNIRERLQSLFARRNHENCILMFAHAFLYAVKTSNVCREEVPTNITRLGIKNAYEDISDIQYHVMIKNTRSCIDIVHIHGSTWTNKVRVYLREKMKDPNMTIRILLLDPRSVFFEPVARFIGQDAAALRRRLEDVMNTWERTYSEATLHRTRKGAKVLLYLTQSFPTQSVYRIDDMIIVNPSCMTKDKTPLLPTLCCENVKNGDGFFNNYVAQIELMIAESSLTIDAAHSSLCLAADITV